jgi:hypothetical protein
MIVVLVRVVLIRVQHGEIPQFLKVREVLRVLMNKIQDGAVSHIRKVIRDFFIQDSLVMEMVLVIKCANRLHSCARN